jgi:CheY-like chemotaxis protein
VAPPRPRLRVLVADDNVDAAESLAMLLEELGAEIRLAHDGEEALAAAEALRPHVAFLDVGMPKLDGYQVGRRIRAERWGADVMLVAVTGWGQPEDRRRSKEAGFDEHLVKPAPVEMVEKVLATADASLRARARDSAATA